MSMTQPAECFELIETIEGSDTHYTHGVFRTLEDAIAHVDASGRNICFEDWDECRVEIRKRTFGVDEQGDDVWARRWVPNCEETGDGWTAITKPQPTQATEEARP